MANPLSILLLKLGEIGHNSLEVLANRMTVERPFKARTHLHILDCQDCLAKIFPLQHP